MERTRSNWFDQEQSVNQKDDLFKKFMSSVPSGANPLHRGTSKRDKQSSSVHSFTGVSLFRRFRFGRPSSGPMSTGSSPSLSPTDKSETEFPTEEEDVSSSSGDSLPPIVGGTLVFQSATKYDLRQEYIILEKETSMEDLASFMHSAWKLQTPKVVLSVISSYEYYSKPSDSDLEDIQIGIIQAAKLTKMWIMTEGVNYGISQIIGDAVAQERARRKSLEGTSAGTEYSDHLVVMAVTSSDDLVYGEAIESGSAQVNQYRKLAIQNRGDDKHELNPNHTHCLLLRGLDSADKEAQWNLKFSLESRLVQHLDKKQQKHKKGGYYFNKLRTPTKEASSTPMVGLLLHGGPKEIERVLWLLKKQIPVIVIRRKGFASGLIAYAYFEAVRGGDSQHLQNIVKPQLMEQVLEAFPDYCQESEHARLQCRDKILECVKYSVQGFCRYLTIMETSHSDTDLKDLSKFILLALYNSQRGAKDYHSRENINWNLRLALDWNRPDFAASKILNTMEISHFKVRDDIFLEALLLPNREQFVELFLNMGFSLHRFLIHSRMLFLFQSSLNNDFFVTIILEKVLGKSKPVLGSTFIDGQNCQLNKILRILTGLHKLVNSLQLFEAHHTLRSGDKHAAEKKALLALIYWAVLNNRYILAKTLWKRSAEPIAVALVISNMYYRLSKNWVTDLDLKKKTKQIAIDFGRLAIEVMDLTFSDSSIVAFYALITPIKDFNNFNVVDLALVGNNIFFIAHPCCQRSMRERWFGHIKIKSFGKGDLHIPEFVKIFLCLFLVFPMYFWLTFDTKEPRKIQYQDEEDSDDENKDKEETIHNTMTSNSFIKLDYYHALDFYGNGDPYATPPLWRKIYYLWTAPITKFWLNQIFILGYLALYALTLMMPYCGNLLLNNILLAWTVVIVIEHARRTLTRTIKFPMADLFWSYIGILMEVLMLAVFFLQFAQNYDYLPSGIRPVNFMTLKLLSSLGLLFSYYRALRYLLPVSQELGPWLVSISNLTRKDLFNWISLWSMCLLSGGIAINTVVYPAQPLTEQSFLGAMLRASLGIFLTEVDDLKGDPTCTPLYSTEEVGNNCNVSSISPYVLRTLEDCPYKSWVGYFMVIQYLLITRLVFYVLMFAMFSVTINRTKERSVEIWKYQFYSLVTDFESRPILPVPLTPIGYPFRIISWLGKVLFILIFGKSRCCRRIVEKIKAGPDTEKYAIPHNQWKSYLSTLSKKEEEKEYDIGDILTQLEEESSAQTVVMKNLNNRLVQIESNQTMTGFILESLINRLEGLDPKVQHKKAQGQIRPVHSASRASPYPGTDVQRFPVLTKDVPWDVQFESYDPGTYSKPIGEYPADLQWFVDPDFLMKLPMHDEDSKSEDPLSQKPKVNFEPQYNTVQTVTLPNGDEMKIDRTSYIVTNDQQIQYEIDSIGVPRNPMGRTGLRGRGDLYHWGPNHMVQAVISRVKVMPAGPQATTTNDPSQVQGRKMEILLMKDGHGSNTVSLPGALAKSSVSVYSGMCIHFMNDVFQEPDPEIPPNFDQEDMVEYFSRFATAGLMKKKKSTYASYGYSAFPVYRGYNDDDHNTDNAWKEAEIWNFHFKYKDSFENKFKEGDVASWMLINANLPLNSSEYTAAVESAKIHSAQY